MKRIIVCVCAWILAGCVDVKIASSVDRVSYLSLQPFAQSQNSCKQNKKVALLDIRSNAPYENTNIYMFDAKYSQMHTLSSKKWIAPPQDLLKTALLLKAQSQCLELSFPPLGTQSFDMMFKLSLLSFHIVEENGAYKAQVSVFYELISLKNHKSKSASIVSSIALESLNEAQIASSFTKASDEVLTRLLKAMQSF